MAAGLDQDISRDRGRVGVQRREALSDDSGENTLRIRATQEWRIALQGMRDNRTVEPVKERDVRNFGDEIATRGFELEQGFPVAGDSTSREARGGRGTGWFESGRADADISNVAPWVH